MPKTLLRALLLLLISTPSTAPASTYVLVDDAPLAAQADLIARAEVVGRRTADRGGVLSTYYEVVITDLISGSFSGSRLEVRVPGGRSADRALFLHGAPEFALGQRLVLFLGANGDGSFRILHLMQGVFREVRLGGTSFLVRDLDEHPRFFTHAAGGPELREPVRETARFLRWLEDLSDGRRRPADYYLRRPEHLDVALEPRFTHLSDKANLRWFEFDRPTSSSVAWHRHVGGQPGIRGGGKSEFTRARSAWRTQTATPIQLVDAGTTDSTHGFGTMDAKNTILFEDFNEVIGDDYVCGEGGIIALGGVHGYYTTERSWKRQLFFAIAEVEIVVNDGVDCLFAESPKLAAQVYAHEIGHTLGLGHSCGDSKSPKCSSSAQLDDAIMRAYAHGKKGAQLGDDDVVGARFLYDPEFFAVPCDLPPGHRKFCKRCGQCGEGQGNCRKSSQCAQGLECAKKVGAEFGFKPKTNVCVQPD